MNFNAHFRPTWAEVVLEKLGQLGPTFARVLPRNNPDNLSGISIPAPDQRHPRNESQLGTHFQNSHRPLPDKLSGSGCLKIIPKLGIIISFTSAQLERKLL